MRAKKAPERPEAHVGPGCLALCRKAPACTVLPRVVYGPVRIIATGTLRRLCCTKCGFKAIADTKKGITIAWSLRLLDIIMAQR